MRLLPAAEMLFGDPAGVVARAATASELAGLCCPCHLFCASPQQ